MSGAFLVVLNGDRGILVACDGWKPGMLFNTLERTGPLTAENDPAPDVNSARAEEPEFKHHRDLGTAF